MKLDPAPRCAQTRCASPEDTVARLEAALAAEYAIVYQEQQVAEHLHWGSLQVDALDFPPMGKGATPLRCKASTLAEAAEWLALRRLRSLPGYREGGQGEQNNPLPIELLLQHIATATPEVIARIQATEAARHWVDGWSLRSERAVKIPLEYLHGISGTNGVAAGNGHAEAIVQGTNEILERRAVITVIKNRLVVPSIDPASIDDPVIRGQLAALESRGIELHIKDLSFGGALPCIGVYFNDPARSRDHQAHHLFKAAAHFDRVAALQSCLTEYAQSLRLNGPVGDPPRHEGMRSDDGTDNFLSLFWFGFVPYHEADFLREGERIPFDPGDCPADCLEDIARYRALFEQLEMDYLVVDLADPRVDFPVLQVIVPGYSDILPYHPASSPVLFEGWTRELPLGYIAEADGGLNPCTAQGLFPEW